MDKLTNPSISEIKEWAYSGDDWPDQEWDLFLSWKQEIPLLIELATDHKCPKKGFFLHMLYYQVGAAIQGNFGREREFIVKGYLAHADNINNGDIRAWVKATEGLLRNPEAYEYDDWRGGKLANYKFT